MDTDKNFCLGILLLATGCVFAQDLARPTFEVASVKVNKEYVPTEVRTWERHVEIRPGTFTMRNVGMIELIEWAYHVQRYQIAGPEWFDVRRPGWSRLDATRYDVLAKAPGAGEDGMRPMLQALLAERFHLTLHRETRTLPVLALVEAKSGHKMRVSQSDTVQDGKQDPQRGNIVRGASMEEMANELSDGREWDAAIVNATGLKGRFDFELNIRKYIPQLKPGDPPPDVLSVVKEALEQELGLKLEPRKMSVEVLVIDHIDRAPSEN
jgi:uncharacterized protein (TIGR03435 family)